MKPDLKLIGIASMKMLVCKVLVGLATCLSSYAQIAPNGGLPGLPISLLPPNPTSADHLRLIMPERECAGGVMYTGNRYNVQMVNNHVVITLGAQVRSGAVPGGLCPPLPGEEIDIGRLPPGNYTMSLVDPLPVATKPVFSNVSFTVSDARAAKAFPFVGLDYSGHWWDPNDSGWGLFIWQDAKDSVLAAWFTYGADGKPIWWVFQPRWRTNIETLDADLVQTSRAPGSTSPPPNPTNLAVVGKARLEFGRVLTVAENGTITYTIGNGPTITRTIQRFKP